MGELITLKTAGMDSDGLQLRTLNGRTYLTGNVIMAKEMVMNSLLYPSDELKRGVPGWNGRPVTVGHPEKDGKPISANSPDVLDKTQIGFIFDTFIEGTDAKLKANVWLDAQKIDSFPEVRDAIANNQMLEVSTGLFIDREEKEGEFNHKKYIGIAKNHLPDHLALLPNEVGACSVEDGAGFPRTNSVMGVNEVAFDEKYRLVRRAVAEKLKEKEDEYYFYIVELFDASVVIYLRGDLFAYSYTMDKETGAVTLGDGEEVFQKIEYPPLSTLGANMNKNTSEEVKVITQTMADAQPADNAAENVQKEPADEEQSVKGNAEQSTEAPANTTDSNILSEAEVVFNTIKKELIEQIRFSTNNEFEEKELDVLPFSVLKKFAKTVTAQANNIDMSGVGGPGGHTTASTETETPYVG